MIIIADYDGNQLTTARSELDAAEIWWAAIRPYKAIVVDTVERTTRDAEMLCEAFGIDEDSMSDEENQ